MSVVLGGSAAIRGLFGCPGCFRTRWGVVLGPFRTPRKRKRKSPYERRQPRKSKPRAWGAPAGGSHPLWPRRQAPMGADGRARVANVQRSAGGDPRGEAGEPPRARPVPPLRFCPGPLRRASNPTSPLGVGGLRRFFFHLPFFPFGEGFTPPPTPSPGPGRGVSRRVGASKMAQDGSKRASESPR